MSFESVKYIIPSYLSAPLAFTLWLVVLWLAKRLVFFRLRKWSSRTKARWDDRMVAALSLPVDLLIVSSGLVLLAELQSIPSKYAKAAHFGLQGCVVLTGVMLLDRIAVILLEKYSRRGALSQVSYGMVRGIARGFIFGIGGLIFLDLIGISITPILASLGIGSLAVALALQDTLSNFFAGIYVAVDKPVELGHFVRLESGQEGFVTDIGWRTTRIRTPANNTIIIPNSKLMSSVITNYHLPEKASMVHASIQVHYDSDLRHVEKITLETAWETVRSCPEAVSDAEPGVKVGSFMESGIEITVALKAREMTETAAVKHAFLKRLHERYRKEGIVMPYPTRMIYTTDRK